MSYNLIICYGPPRAAQPCAQPGQPGYVLLFSRLGRRLGRAWRLGDRFRPFTLYRFAFALAFVRFVLCAFARLFLPTGGVGLCPAGAFPRRGSG
jgi:hypothetical protein